MINPLEKMALTLMQMGFSPADYEAVYAMAEEDKAKLDKAVTKRKVEKTILKGDAVSAFNFVWGIWPWRSDGQPSKGSRPQAERCFQDIVDSGVATAHELAMCADIYSKHPNVQAGYVQHVATFYALRDGLWREALEKVRTTHA